MAVIVGADRSRANGDVATKIGTFPWRFGKTARHSVLRRCALFDTGPEDPMARTFQSNSADAKEVTHIGGVRIVPAVFPVFNPAFDVTPMSLWTCDHHGPGRCAAALLQSTGKGSEWRGRPVRPDARRIRDARPRDRNPCDETACRHRQGR